MKNLIFYDVDTQKDFMSKGGSLYVPNSDGIVENLERLTMYAVSSGIQVFGSVDRHFPNDNELKTFPPHCMDGTDGAKKVFHTYIPGSAFIENRPHSDGDLKLKLSKPAVYFEKQETDVFSNAYANGLSRFGAAIVYGVATDYCVKDAVLGMRSRGIDVLVVEDAIMGVNDKSSRKAIDEMKYAGAIFVSTWEVVDGDSKRILQEKWR